MSKFAELATVVTPETGLPEGDVTEFGLATGELASGAGDASPCATGTAVCVAHSARSGMSVGDGVGV